MKFVEWSSLYLSGNEVIDREHRELFEIANEFYRNIKEKNENKVVFETLNHLIRYAEKHFTDEERFLKSIGYPADKLDHHRLVHQKLIEQIFEIYETEYMISGTRIIEQPEEIRRFLADWLVLHILEEDRDYFQYIADMDK